MSVRALPTYLIEQQPKQGPGETILTACTKTEWNSHTAPSPPCPVLRIIILHLAGASANDLIGRRFGHQLLPGVARLL